MKVKIEIIKKLVESNNPILEIGKELLLIWQSASNLDVSEYYDRGEIEARSFEEFILKANKEIFEENLPRNCLEKKVPLQKPEDGVSYIVFDGLSLREGVLIYKNLKKKGLDVEISLSYSMVPSTTEAFRDKIDFARLKRELSYAEITDANHIQLSGKENFIWSRFPDVLLDKIQSGRTLISSLENMLHTTLGLCFKLLDRLSSKKIIILSDHGYIRSEAGYVFTPQKPKKMHKVFGSNRFISMNEVEADDLVEDGTVVSFNGYYLVKSRYVWPVPGKYNVYLHGGVSLMECFTPVIEVNR